MSKRYAESLGSTQLQIDRTSEEHKNFIDCSRVLMSHKKAVAPHWPHFGSKDEVPNRHAYALSRLLHRLVPDNQDQHIDARQRRHVSEFTQSIAWHAEDLIPNEDGSVLTVPEKTDNSTRAHKRQLWDVTDVGIGLQNDGQIPKIMVSAKLSANATNDAEKQQNEAVVNNLQCTEEQSTVSVGVLQNANQQVSEQSRTSALFGSANPKQKKDYTAANLKAMAAQLRESSAKNEESRQQQKDALNKRIAEQAELLTPLEGVIRSGSSIEPITDLLSLNAIPAVVPILTSIIEKTVNSCTEEKKEQSHPQATAYFVSLLQPKDRLQSIDENQLNVIVKRLAQIEAASTPHHADMERLLNIAEEYNYAQRHAQQTWRAGYTLAKWMSFYSFGDDADNPDHMFRKSVYGENDLDNGEPIFHSFRDQGYRKIVVEHPAAELVDALNTWAGYRAFNTIDDALQCMYSSKDYNQKVRGLYNNKGPSLITGPTIVVIEGENLGRVQFKTWLQTDGKLLDRCKQDYRQLLAILCAMPTERVLAEIEYKYQCHRPYTRTVYPFVFDQDNGWQTKVANIASMLSLEDRIHVHRHLLEDALSIKWLIPTWNSDSMHRKDPLGLRKRGVVQELFHHFQTTKDIHLNNKSALMAIKAPRKNKNFLNMYAGGNEEARTNRTNLIWERLADKRSNKYLQVHQSEFAKALQKHQKEMRKETQRALTYRQATITEANQLIDDLEKTQNLSQQLQDSIERTRAEEAERARQELARQEERRQREAEQAEITLVTQATQAQEDISNLLRQLETQDQQHVATRQRQQRQ